MTPEGKREAIQRLQAEGAVVAMVTDLQGKASASSDPGSPALTILAELQSGAEV